MGRLWGGHGEAMESYGEASRVNHYPQDSKSTILRIRNSPLGSYGEAMEAIYVVFAAIDWLWTGYGEAMGRLWEAMYVLI